MAAVTAALLIGPGHPASSLAQDDPGEMKSTIRLPAPGPAAGSADSGRERTTVTGPAPNKSPVALPKAISANPGSTPLLKGQVTYTVPQGTGIKLKLASVPTACPGLRLMDRDLDGKLYPAQLDQEITARTTEDLYVDDKKVIPEGTVFHGKVTRIYPPKRVGRPGSLALSFDSFTTPDGRKFAFRCQANNTRASTLKSKAKGFGLIMAHGAGGAVVGALVAYSLCGLQNTIAMHGYNIAGGAAVGALGGLAVALMRHGERAVLEPGDDLNMEIDTDLLLPAATEPTVKEGPPSLPGLEIEVLHSKVLKDGLEGYELRLDTIITNNTDRRLNSIDLFVEDDNGHRFPLASSDDEDSDQLFHVDPHSIERLHLNFVVEYPKLKRKLVWTDHESRKDLFEQRLP